MRLLRATKRTMLSCRRVKYWYVCGARSSRISEEKFRELMLHGNDMASDVGTVVYGEEAVQLGLIDRVGQLKDAYEALYAML